MRLSAPSLMTLLVSVLLVLAGILAQLGLAQIPIVSSSPFGTVLAGCVILGLGILVRGL